MSPEDLAQNLVERWVYTYTSGLDEQTAERRRAEIHADLHDHIAHGRRHGHHSWRVAGEVVLRSLRGVPADLVWRGVRRDSTAGRRAAELIGGSAMNATATAAKAIGLTVAVLVVLYLMAGWIFHTARPGPDLRAVAVWLVFGAAVVAVSRLLAPAVVIGAATLLALIAGCEPPRSRPAGPRHHRPQLRLRVRVHVDRDRCAVRQLTRTNRCRPRCPSAARGAGGPHILNRRHPTQRPASRWGPTVDALEANRSSGWPSA